MILNKLFGCTVDIINELKNEMTLHGEESTLISDEGVADVETSSF